MSIFVLMALMAAMGTMAGEFRFTPRTYRYPAPRETIVLDGEWEYRCPKDYRHPERAAWEKVRTPYVGSTDWRTMRAVHRYRREFDVPALDGRRAILHFECIPCVAQVTVNGRDMGMFGSVGAPFDVDMTDVAVAGTNRIEFSVREVSKKEKLANGGIWVSNAPWEYGPYMGYLRPIVLELRPQVAVDDVAIECEMGKKLKVVCSIVRAGHGGGKVTAECRVMPWPVENPSNRTCRPTTIEIGTNTTVSLEIPCPDIAEWTPDTPNLNGLEITLRNKAGTVVDRRCERFGFRVFTTKKDKVFINGIPFMLRRMSGTGGVGGDAEIRETILRLKRRGINGIRCLPVHAARWVDMADELGFFVSVLYPGGKVKMYREEKQWAEYRRGNLDVVQKYRNHPSILAWGIGGEMASYYGLTADDTLNAALVEKMKAVAEAVKALDPTRWVVSHGDNEIAWPRNGKGPATVRTWHYPNPPTLDRICYPEGAWWYYRKELSYHGIQDREKPICIGEDFYHGFHDQFFGLTKWGGDKIWHLDGYLEMWRDAVWMAADGYYDADLAGWNLWSAAEASVTNLLFDVTCGGQLMPDYLISIREPYRNLYAGEVEKRTLTVYNKRFLDREVRLVREVLAADGTRPVAERADLPGKTMWRFTVPAGGRHVMEVEVGVPDIQGGHSLRDGPRDRPETEMHRYTLFDAKTGERLFARDWIYNIFPKTAFAWPEGVVLLGAAVAGRHALPSGRSGDGSLAVTEVDAAMAAGRPIVVTKSLTTAEGLKLKKFVVEGGRVMIIEAKGPGWTPIPLIENKMQSFVFRREGGVMPEVDERMLACWRPDALVGSSGYVKPSDRTVEVMFDSGHQYGLTEMQIGRVWDGKGHWFLYQMPVGGRPDAAADFVLAAAVREFLKGPKALDRHLTLKADDPLCEVFRANKILFDTREDAKSVHLADLDPTDPEQRKGLSNEDRYLSVAKLGDVKFRFENTGMVSPKWNPVDAVRTNFDWAVDMKLHPRKTQTVLRTMLRNLGVNAAEPAPETVESPLWLGKFVNRPVWNDPRLGSGVTAWFGEEDDMRYFPVNLCGWSRDSGNHCPVESVPAEAINFAGYPFRISQGTFDGVEMPGSIVLEPGEKKRLKVWQKNVKMFRFLGALRKHVSAGEALKIAYGYVNHSRFEDVVKAGDALNGYRWAGAIDNGKVGWTGFSKEEAAAVLYVWHVPAKRLGPLAGYTNFVELENVGTSAIAIVGMTLEHLP